MDFKDHWDLETAMRVVQNQTVDSKLWAEAVEWLLRYGPPEIVDLLLTASNHASEEYFPELKVVDYSENGQACYDIRSIAKSLGISEEETKKIIAEKENYHNIRYVYNGGSDTVH